MPDPFRFPHHPLRRVIPEQVRANRLQSIEDSRKRGTAPFLDAQIQNLIGESTRRNRPHIVAEARTMMNTLSVDGLTAIQRGMAERPDSVPTLPSIQVPTMVIAGGEDTLTPVENGQLMQTRIRGAKLTVTPHVGHYAAWENPEEYSRVVFQFLEGLVLSR